MYGATITFIWRFLNEAFDIFDCSALHKGGFASRSFGQNLMSLCFIKKTHKTVKSRACTDATIFLRRVLRDGCNKNHQNQVHRNTYIFLTSPFEKIKPKIQLQISKTTDKKVLSCPPDARCAVTPFVLEPGEIALEQMLARCTSRLIGPKKSIGNIMLPDGLFVVMIFVCNSICRKYYQALNLS